jgi:hypothetical protein
MHRPLLAIALVGSAQLVMRLTLRLDEAAFTSGILGLD